MKKLTQYLTEVESDEPQVGDAFIFESDSEDLIETTVIEVLEDGVVLESDAQAEALLQLEGYQLEAIRRYGAVGSSPGMGFAQNEDADMGPGDHLNAIENGLVGGQGALAEQEPLPPDANHNDPLLSKAIDDAAVPAMENDLMSRILELAQVREADSWMGRNTDRPAHLRKADYERQRAPGSVHQKFRVPGDPNVPAQQRRIQPGDEAPSDKKMTTAEGSGDPTIDKMTDKDLADYIGKEASWVTAHRDEAERMADDLTKDLDEALNKMRRAAGIMEDPTEEEPMPAQSAVATEPQHSVSDEPGSAAARAFEGRLDEAESPVSRAIVQRILASRLDLLQKHGPERLGDAIDTVASFVGQVDEIGTSDVSGWVKEVERELESPSRMSEAEYQDTEVMGEMSMDQVTINGKPVDIRSIQVDGVDTRDYPDFADSYATYAEFKDGTPLSDEELRILQDKHGDVVYQAVYNSLSEAEYQGRDVPLGKPMRGDVKKFKVYVRDPKTGNVKKVNFGDKTMRIKKSNPARRKSFRARHNCDNPGPRTKARYWSCRKW